MQQRVFLCHIFLCFQKSNIFLSLFRTKSRLYRGEHTAMVLCSQSVPVRLPASLYRLSGATGWPEEPIVLTSEGGLVGVVRDVGPCVRPPCAFACFKLLLFKLLLPKYWSYYWHQQQKSMPPDSNKNTFVLLLLFIYFMTQTNSLVGA